MIAKAIKDHKKAIIPYVTAGLPDFDTTGKILLALQDAGAAAIEIGIPFSDPMADGPVLQKASYLALRSGFKMDELQGRLTGWSTMLEIPLVVMSYINPLMRRGLRQTLANLKDCGVRGAIIPDLPRDADKIYADCCKIGMDLIRMVAPTTEPLRMREVLSQCSGFVYAVSTKGVTGSRSDLPPEVRAQVGAIKGMTDLPVCVGFGVSSAAQVDDLLTFADGVIVGSYLMGRIMDSTDPARIAYETLHGLLNGG
jgi:tryptophan synthase alpha chain